MMLGFLLARAGVEVTVLEKHRDFLRDFRGDTVHPSTLQVMHELGLLEELLARPHSEVRALAGDVEGERVQLVDFSHLPGKAPFVAFMPQWEFLDFIAEHARRLANFRLRMESEVVDLLREGDHVVGVQVKTVDGPVDLLADLVVGADGRKSVIRERAGLMVQDLGTPMDVLWMRLSRRAGDPEESLGYLTRGHLLAMIDRSDYWQCGFVIPKGGFDLLRGSGIAALRGRVAAIAPFLQDRVHELRDWSDVRLLTVRIDRLREWAVPGLLCIGDAAHAMSPVGGVGINLAIQDAVATANLLASSLLRGAPTLRQLQAVQSRRELPTRLTQRLQLMVQNSVIQRVLDGTPLRVPWAARSLDSWPWLRRLPGRLIGLGFRPEHVQPAMAS